MVDLGGYVIILLEKNGKMKLYGSAAERSDCDEILEINGKSLENASHHEIIDHIHQCIRTRTICLRVKRRTASKIAAIDSSLVDAFVIGSRAREHLQHIARDATITAKDIAQLSRKAEDIEKNKTEKSVITKAVESEEKSSKEKNKLCKSSSGEGDIEFYELSDENMELVELNTKNLSTNRTDPPYKERAVDVPESFVGIIKQAPRYPPPQLTQPKTTISTSISSSTFVSSSSDHKIESDKLRRYPEEISRKLEEETFIRSSLRSSKKLQLKHHSTDFNRKDDRLIANDGYDEDNYSVQKGIINLDLNSVLNRVIEQVNEDVKVIADRTNLSKLIAIYNTIMQQKCRKYSFPYVTISASDLVQEIILLLQEEPEFNLEAEELLEILTKFELNGLLFAFDHVLSSQLESDQNKRQMQENVAKENISEPKETSVNYLSNPNIRVVKIEKYTCEPLGATARNDPDGSVIIGRIVKGGAAEKSGLLKEGDEILEVNGIEMKSRNVHQVCDLLAAMKGTLTFVIASRETSKPSPTHQHIMNLKALFDYDPDGDLYIPCHELGLGFAKGDILHVIDQSDTNWWQAYREGGHDSSLAGLIPSAHFQHKRMKQSIIQNSGTLPALNYKNRLNKKASASSLLLNCGKRSRNKKKKLQSLISSNDEILVYEEVALYYPRANAKRPIVLIGPTNIGRHELRQKLMQDTERFSAAVPHTSRPKRDGEINGIDYYFTSRQAFEQDIKEGKFVEHGEFEKNYYGTSLGAIESVVQSGKICVLNLHVHSIPILRQGYAGAKLKPYFVFAAPPQQLERLNKLISSICSGQDGSNLSISELQSIIDEARDIENRFGHYFDMILTINDIDQAFHDLLREINALEREPQWIPSIWMK